jgi:hypothetical protein
MVLQTICDTLEKALSSKEFPRTGYLSCTGKR